MGSTKTRRRSSRSAAPLGQTGALEAVDNGGERGRGAIGEDSDWVRNVRTAGWGYLAYGKGRSKVRVTELDRDDREPTV